ncbi:MAG: glycosyltransferase family 2 protein [Nitrospira sp.]|nr:glycosyltransferase family 2 protein [Nitrospira sp.]
MSKPASQPLSRPLVSVVIPTYKRAKLLEMAIVSAFAQEKAGELFDLEVIVVDDCSPDNTAQVAAKFPAVHYVKLPQNRGASGARNAGIKLAKGKYIALLDDDDEFLTHKLMVQVPLLEAHPEIGVIYGQSVVTGGETPLLLWPEWGPSGDVFEEFLTRTDDFLHPPTWLVRRELFEAAGFFDESKAGMEHYDMALRIAARTPWMFLSGGPVARGRYSQQGLWYSTIADGTNEQQLPKIVEAALAGLPATTHGDQIRHRARAAVCASIAHQRWWAGGGLEPTRTHLLASLRGTPSFLTEPVVIDWLKRVACALATSSEHPVQAVKTFWEDISRAVAGAPVIHRALLRRLLGELLAAAAISMKQGSPRMSPLVALNAVLNDPGYWLQPSRLLSFCRAWTREPSSSSGHDTASVS